jgi:hypothetical protein
MSVAVIEGSGTEFNPVEERCDRCGARGYTKFSKLDSTLIFCNHHGREFGDELIFQGWMLTSVEM